MPSESTSQPIVSVTASELKRSDIGAHFLLDMAFDRLRSSHEIVAAARTQIPSLETAASRLSDAILIFEAAVEKLTSTPDPAGRAALTTTDAAPYRKALKEYFDRADSLNLRRFAAEAGLCQSLIVRVRDGETPRIKIANAEKLKAILETKGLNVGGL
jgi:hypothetical protein